MTLLPDPGAPVTLDDDQVIALADYFHSHVPQTSSWWAYTEQNLKTAILTISARADHLIDESRATRRTSLSCDD